MRLLCMVGWIAWLLALAALRPAQAAAQDDSARDAHRVLQVATMSSMLVTASLGTIVALNKPTLLSDGRCAEHRPILGEYGCHGLSVLHGFSALLTLTLYTATTTLEFAKFDWPGQQDHNGLYRGVSYVHLIGMGLLPFVGLTAAVPQVFGLEDGNSDFSRVLRSLHITAAYLTVGTYVATAAIDF